MKTFLPLALATAALLVACSKSSTDDPKPAAIALAAQWQADSTWLAEPGAGMRNVRAFPAGAIVHEFTATQYKVYFGGVLQSAQQYSRVGDSLIISPTTRYHIRSLTARRLVLAQRPQGEPSGTAAANVTAYHR